MELWEAIKGRRSIGKMKTDMPPRESIEKMLEAANWAPSHFRTEPWKFFVLTGAARERLGEAMATILRDSLNSADPTEIEERLNRQRNNPLRAPIIIAVASRSSDDARVIEVEQIEAVACAVQNMMLAGHELGLGTIWRTGGITYEPKLKEFFGLEQGEHLLGFVYVGYPDQVIKPGMRKPISLKTVWLEN
ncbi:nitroreductase [Ammoniphilus sp. CFH 90114]|uniref:nitroreductase family protein n=1 Tax=Ammoniphilus sp. CFH 90114 TaxID=2493665 RepID=UPI00100E1A16|nr:nitroreductase [Ammoniphilus sp. CFH 90114]RXT05220.1 nitroreductase [Ammoniphilus sp. CFH 90114]